MWKLIIIITKSKVENLCNINNSGSLNPCPASDWVSRSPISGSGCRIKNESMGQRENQPSETECRRQRIAFWWPIYLYLSTSTIYTCAILYRWKGSRLKRFPRCSLTPSLFFACRVVYTFHITSKCQLDFYYCLPVLLWVNHHSGIVSNSSMCINAKLLN